MALNSAERSLEIEKLLTRCGIGNYNYPIDVRALAIMLLDVNAPLRL